LLNPTTKPVLSPVNKPFFVQNATALKYIVKINKKPLCTYLFFEIYGIMNVTKNNDKESITI